MMRKTEERERERERCAKELRLEFWDIRKLVRMLAIFFYVFLFSVVPNSSTHPVTYA